MVVVSTAAAPELSNLATAMMIAHRAVARAAPAPCRNLEPVQHEKLEDCGDPQAVRIVFVREVQYIVVPFCHHSEATAIAKAADQPPHSSTAIELRLDGLKSAIEESADKYTQFQGRMDVVEKLLGDSVDRLAACEKTLAVHADHLSVSVESHTAVQVRLDYIEVRLLESTGKHAEALAAHASFENELKRFDGFEKSLADTVGKHAQWERMLREWVDSYTIILEKHLDDRSRTGAIEVNTAKHIVRHAPDMDAKLALDGYIPCTGCAYSHVTPVEAHLGHDKCELCRNCPGDS